MGKVLVKLINDKVNAIQCFHAWTTPFLATTSKSYFAHQVWLMASNFEQYKTSHHTSNHSFPHFPAQQVPICRVASFSFTSSLSASSSFCSNHLSFPPINHKFHKFTYKSISDHFYPSECIYGSNFYSDSILLKYLTLCHLYSICYNYVIML